MLEKKDESVPDLLQKKKIGPSLHTPGLNQHMFISATFFILNRI